ncbi:LysR substrate-binding domain-containing protein [Porticoccus sp. W117]|uniref:LysR substrate-binding domain-containing protein n=1 Tax=Porticoccus sp. W117 TaxID=3054777 RepID=UPI002598DE29|nr:LysR substrate-binding domain-containing protein [Porticoccus sp. W117]MDM3871574.1 LysR substrate-binding domain-containing protein [Porticoccus sp. W117]
MKLQQLRYFVAIAENGFNITAASEQLYTSQPGVSKQLKLLEEELGLRLFSRSGKTLDGITEAGEQVLVKAKNILREVDNIKQLSDDLQNEHGGVFTIGTTHTQARYVLPDIFSKFRELYPDVQLDLHQGTNDQIDEWLKTGHVDFAIASSAKPRRNNMVTLPCYYWDQALLIPRDHPLAKLDQPELEDIVRYPIVTYLFSSTDRSTLVDAIRKAGLEPNIAITARDADVIKTYVREGLGIGFVANMAYHPVQDNDLVAISTHDILPTYTTWIGFREDLYLSNFTYDFIAMLAPHLQRELVDQAIQEYRDNKVITCIDEKQLPYRLIQQA